MIPSKYNLLCDIFHGSSGKGKMSTWLADFFKVNVFASTNMPNAGHSALIKGEKFIAKALPTAAILNKYRKAPYWDDGSPAIFIGPSAVFSIEQLLKEIDICQLDPKVVFIHPRAGVITEAHKQIEMTDMNGPKTIASTCQGSGAYLSDKIMRRPNLKVARDYEELHGMVVPEGAYWVNIVNGFMEQTHKTVLHEVAQGIGLDIHHGSHYPNCTSRQCLPQQAVADMGIRLENVGDIYGNVHATPIRVGNIVEQGNTVGYSGDFYPDAKELSWEEIGLRAGMPREEIDRLTTSQLTTVTKRLRRVFEFSYEGLRRNVYASGATKLILNFAQYVDWKAHKVRVWEDLPKPVKSFVYRIEDETKRPVVAIGTGEDFDDVVARF